MAILLLIFPDEPPRKSILMRKRNTNNPNSNISILLDINLYICFRTVTPIKAVSNLLPNCSYPLNFKKNKLYNNKKYNK